MRRPRTHRVYVLLDRHEVVYYGITSRDLHIRATEHRKLGKRFTNIHQVGNIMSEESARVREQELLDNYRRRHQGQNPRYNQAI